MLYRINIPIIKTIAYPNLIIITAFSSFIQCIADIKQNEYLIIQDQLKDKLVDLQEKYDERGFQYPEL